MGLLKNSTLAIASTISVIAAVTSTPTTLAIATRPQLQSQLPMPVLSVSRSAAPIALPDTGAQDDSWSCGPNSAARVLRYYGHDVDYAKIRAATEKKLFLPQKLRNPLNNQWLEVRTGTPPQTLQQVMRRWEGDRVKKLAQSNFGQLVNLVRSGKPAIALVRVGGLSIPYVGAIPYLHWVAVTGVDPQAQTIYYTDTNSQTYQISYQDFQARWSLGLDQDVSQAIAHILKNNGVEARTLVWVDR